MAYKTLNNNLKIDGRKILVNDEWSFVIPSGIEYFVDADFDGGIQIGGTSSEKKPLVLKGLKSNGNYLFNFSLDKHIHLLGSFYTIVDCKYDNRIDPNATVQRASQKIIVDEDNFFVDVFTENIWPFGNDTSIRVRGTDIEPCNFSACLKDISQEEFTRIAAVLKEIAGSIKLEKKSSKSSAPKKVNSINDPDFICEGKTCLRYKGSDTDIVFPEGITEIADNIFSGKRITSVEIPEGVKSIGRRAFENCFNLEYVSLPSSLEEIGGYCFVDCHELKSIEFGNKIKSIGDSAFSECYKLGNVKIPNKVKLIESFAFKNCREFTEFTIPEGCTSIGFNAFSYCKNLEYLYIPSSVTEIRDNFGDQTPFDGCKSLTIHTPSGSYAEEYCKSHNIKYVCDDKPRKIKPVVSSKPVSSKKHLNEDDIDEPSVVNDYPKTFTIRGNKLIKYTGKAYSVDIPDCVEIIGAGAFEGNKDTRRIYIRDGVKKIESNALADLNEYCKIYIAQSVEDIAGDAFGDKKDELLKIAMFGDFRFGAKTTVCAVKGSLAYGTAEALKIPVEECKPSEVAKKKKREKVVTELKIAESTSETSKKYFTEFKKTETPKVKRKMFDKNAERSKDINASGCDVMLVNLYDLASQNNKDLAKKAKVVDDYFYSLSDFDYTTIISKALEYSEIFKVEDDKFNPKSDRYTEIHKGYIKHISMVHNFMSFIYVVSEYCHKKKNDDYTLTSEELTAVKDFIESCGGTNFKAGQNILQGFNEKNYYVYYNYVGDDILKKAGIGFKMDYENSTRLDLVINELNKYENIISMIYNHLDENRNYSEPLTGTYADILAIWCTYALASVAPFAAVDGLKDYDLTPYSEEDFSMPESFASLVKTDGDYVTFDDVLIKYTGSDSKLVIPEGINMTTRIGDLYPKDIKIDTVVFPKSLEVYPGKTNIYIPYGACNIEFTSDKLVIEKDAFKNHSLKSIILPEGTTSIGSDAFYYCGKSNDKLKIRVPSSVTSLCDDSFYYRDTELIVYHDSYAERFVKQYNEKNKDSTYKQFTYSVEYTEAQKAQMKREAEEKERLRREAEERRRAEEAAKKAEEARIAAQRKAEYEALAKEKETLLQTIAENKGLFGEKARKRKEAKAKLEEVESNMSKYPEFNK